MVTVWALGSSGRSHSPRIGYCTLSCAVYLYYLFSSRFAKSSIPVRVYPNFTRGGDPTTTILSLTGFSHTRFNRSNINQLRARSSPQQPSYSAGNELAKRLSRENQPASLLWESRLDDNLHLRQRPQIQGT